MAQFSVLVVLAASMAMFVFVCYSIRAKPKRDLYVGLIAALCFGWVLAVRMKTWSDIFAQSRPWSILSQELGGPVGAIFVGTLFALLLGVIVSVNISSWKQHPSRVFLSISFIGVGALLYAVVSVPVVSLPFFLAAPVPLLLGLSDSKPSSIGIVHGFMFIGAIVLWNWYLCGGLFSPTTFAQENMDGLFVYAAIGRFGDISPRLDSEPDLLSQAGTRVQVSVLLSCGADPNRPHGVLELTPLHSQVENGGPGVELLLEHGAKVDSRDWYGNTPLHVCNDESIAEVLLKHGANVESRNFAGETPLLATCSWRRREVAQMLIRNGCNVNARDMDGTTPLHAAIDSSDIALICLLLDSDADVNAVDSHGRSPLDIAESGSSRRGVALDWAMLALLRRYGARSGEEIRDMDGSGN